MKKSGKRLICLIAAAAFVSAVAFSACADGSGERTQDGEVAGGSGVRLAEDNAATMPVRAPGGGLPAPDGGLSRAAGSLLCVPSARTEGVFALEPRCSEGTELIYDSDEICVAGVSQYGIITFTETKELRIRARFGEGRTYSEGFSRFFPDEPERVTVTELGGGEFSFVFHAAAGERAALSELTGIYICAVPETLPRLEISCGAALSELNKTDWTDARFELSPGTESGGSGAYSGRGSIKGRGNMSWEQPKRSYSVKLSEPESLLGIPATKKYALTAAYSDRALIRNYITYKAGARLSGIGYTPKCELIELSFNGEYLGVYLLVERVDAEETKLDLPSAGLSALTGGYLIEKTVEGKYDPESDIVFDCPYRANFDKDIFILHWPEPASPDEEEAMTDYLEDYFERLDAAVTGKSGEDPLKYIDIPSWADFLIMQELTKNIDGNLKTSCYMYKMPNDDRLYMTALWDFDLAYGNSEQDNGAPPYNLGVDCPSGHGPEGFMLLNSSCPWYEAVYKNVPEFRAAVMQRYAEYRSELIPELRASVCTAGAYLEAAGERDAERWGGEFVPAVRELLNWLDERVSWLDGRWLPGCGGIGISTPLDAEGRLPAFRTVGTAMRGVSVGSRLAAASGNTDVHDSLSGAALTLLMRAGDTLSFDYRVSSEYGYDHFIFSANGEQLILASGETGWTGYTFTAKTSGRYVFKWVYAKDAAGSAGCDRIWLSDIRFSGQYPFPPPGSAQYGRENFAPQPCVLP